MKIDAGWQQQATLRDGTRVRLRHVRPDDKERMERAFAKLSLDSRYRRFLSPKTRLTPEELRYLTELDPAAHIAIGAEDLDGSGVGIARCVRLTEDPDAAEAAVTVADDHQRKGVGRLLLAFLSRAALDAGIRRFRFQVLTSNAPMISLVRQLAPTAHMRARDAIYEVDVPLPEADAVEADLFRLLKLGAIG